MVKLPPIEEFWAEKGFPPNDAQKRAILHTDGPLFLTAGPGSGKTRVLLWRTLNLIVYHEVNPEKIFLATFTEKAAAQLRDGLLSLLGMVTNRTGKPYDISNMALGTAHSICQKIITDRYLNEGMERRRPPILLDDLGQYFRVFSRNYWKKLCLGAGYEDDESANVDINDFFSTKANAKGSQSRHIAVTSVIGLFNRLSEEMLDPDECDLADVDISNKETLTRLIAMYKIYLEDLKTVPKHVDFSLLQRAAFDQINSWKGAGEKFQHVIVDEYQDTNSIQEKIYFTLAKGHKNICVVGDDDQALYRFRGATVENWPPKKDYYRICICVYLGETSR